MRLCYLLLTRLLGGHHLAHISVPVTNKTTFSELKTALRSEVMQGAVAGRVSAEILESDTWNDAAIFAIEAMETKTVGYTGPMFPELQEEEEDADYSVYAYFVFTVEE